MTVRRTLLQALAVLALLHAGAPARAQTQDPRGELGAITPQHLFQDLIRDNDVTLLFKHLREAMAAAARGEEAHGSEALQRRAEQIQRELAAHGSALLGALLSAAEAEARRALREAPPRRAPGSI